MMKNVVMMMTIAAALVAAADTLTLKSGSVLVGTPGKIADGKLKFTTDELGEVAIPTDNIVKLVGAADQKEIPVATLPVEEKPPETWHGSINVAYSGDRGNSYLNSGTVLASVSRRWEKDRFKADFGYYYSESGTDRRDKTKSTDRWELEARDDHFWTERVFQFVGARYEEDDIAGLDHRFRAYTGLGFQYLDGYEEEHTGIWSFNQQLGLSYINEKFDPENPDADEDTIAFTYRHELKYKPKWNKDMEIFHNLEYLPQCDDFDNYLLRADVGLTTKLVMNFNLIVKVLWDYNSRPANDRDQLDTHYIVGLGYEW